MTSARSGRSRSRWARLVRGGRRPCSGWNGDAGRTVCQRPGRRQYFTGCEDLLYCFQHPLLCTRRVGRRAPGRGIPQGRVHALPARGRDALQPDSRSPALTIRGEEPAQARAPPSSYSTGPVIKTAPSHKPASRLHAARPLLHCNDISLAVGKKLIP